MGTLCPWKGLQLPQYCPLPCKGLNLQPTPCASCTVHLLPANLPPLQLLRQSTYRAFRASDPIGVPNIRMAKTAESRQTPLCKPTVQQGVALRPGDLDSPPRFQKRLQCLLRCRLIRTPEVGDFFSGQVQPTCMLRR